MNPLTQILDFHKKEFKLKKDHILGLLEKLISDSPCNILECAPIITPQKVYANRIRTGYFQKDIHCGWKAALRFIDQVGKHAGINLNRTILEQIIDQGFDLTKVEALGIGIDTSGTINNRKIKLYFAIKEYPQKIEQVLSLYPFIERMTDFITHSELIFGIDMFFDGQTRLDIYPCLHRYDIENTALMAKLNFHETELRLIRACNMVYISFLSSGKRVFYFCPQNSTRFIRALDNGPLNRLYGIVQILNFMLGKPNCTQLIDIIVILIQDEIKASNIQNICFSYGLKLMNL